MSKDDIILFGTYGMRGEGKSFHERFRQIQAENEKLNKELEEKEAILGGIQQLEAEIERLNNIINELETYICTLEYDRRLDNSVWTTAVLIHNKLKELKENK